MIHVELRYFLQCALLCLCWVGVGCSSAEMDRGVSVPARLTGLTFPACEARVPRRQLLVEYTLVNGPQPRPASTLRLYAGHQRKVLCGEKALASSEDGWLSTDALGNLVAQLELPRLAPYEQRQISVSLTLAGLSEEVDLPHTAIIGNDPLTHSTDAGVLGRIETLSGHPRDKRASRVIEWLYKHVKPAGYHARPQRPERTLVLGQGDCTDLSILAVSLLRGLGISAHLVNGYTCSPSCKQMLPHTWVMYRERDGWVEIDLTRPKDAQRPDLNIPLALWHSSMSALKLEPLHELVPPMEEGQITRTVRMFGGSE